MENNKLIAEFMELEATPKYNPKEYYVKEYNSGEWYLPEEMKYHTSWDWLMPVINKIRSMESTYEVEEVGKYDWDNEISHYEFDLDLTYESVIKFIKE
tara:strand:+ start:2529 stop:2822 length:294 start_codon:yes stop_codon:yes gene_type:complete